MKKVILVHGWGGSSQGGWFDWLRNELETKGFEVLAWDMPDTDKPKIEEWVGFLKEKVPNPDEKTYFVGHSIGCQTIMRYLENLPEDVKVGGAVFVAGWFNLTTQEDPEDEKISEPWIKTSIDCEKIKNHTNNFVAIFSDDDPFVPLTDKDLFEERLNAKTVVEHNKEHFNECEKLPIVLDSILEMEK